MDQKKTQTNVIQFPGGSRPKAEGTSVPQPSPPVTESRAQQRLVTGAMLAVALFSFAVNHFAFRSSTVTELSSQGRGLASVERVNWVRDAAWEKSLAERLAKSKHRGTASLSLGRPATKEEQLVLGILGEVYTVNYHSSGGKREISSVALQDATSQPAYILNRLQFLSEYGELFESEFKSARLVSVEKSEDKTVEAYELVGQDDQSKGEARFELDRHKRLISLKVEPISI